MNELEMLPCSAERKEAIARAVADYIKLEGEVQAAHLPVCAPICARCQKVCCAHKFCYEAIDSPWLRLAWQQAGVDETDFDSARGWLTPRGCGLPAGRPPVCYAFLCSQILEPMSGQPEREFHLDQAALITCVGRRALGPRALVELTREEIADRLDLDRLHRAIATVRIRLQADCGTAV